MDECVLVPYIDQRSAPVAGHGAERCRQWAGEAALLPGAHTQVERYGASGSYEDGLVSQYARASGTKHRSLGAEATMGLSLFWKSKIKASGVSCC